MAKLIDWYKSTRSYLAKDIRVFSGSDVVEQSKMPFLANWMHAAKLGMPRLINVPELRQYAKAPWVQMVTGAITKQVMNTEWDVVPQDEEQDSIEQHESDIEKVKQFLNFPNQNGDAFWDIWKPFLRDVLELDAGVIYKAKSNSGELKQMFAYDGGRFLININEHGLIGYNEKGENVNPDGSPVPAYYQYSFRQVAAAPVPFEKNELIYGAMNVNAELAPYGWSPLQSIVQEVELMIQSTRFNKDRFSNSNIPDGIVSVPMDREQMTAFKNAWDMEIKGRAHKLLFHNSEASFTPLSMNNKEMEWLEGQKWYFHTIFAAYGLSPQEVGYYENSNKSTGESQERITIKNAIKPYLTLIESKINREIIPELIGHDNIRFKWFPKDDAAEKIEHEQMMAKLAANVLTINEVRAVEGLEDVEWGDAPMMMSMQQNALDSANAEDDEDPKKEDRDKDKNQIEESKKLYNQLFKGFMNNGKQ